MDTADKIRAAAMSALVLTALALSIGGSFAQPAFDVTTPQGKAAFTEWHRKQCKQYLKAEACDCTADIFKIDVTQYEVNQMLQDSVLPPLKAKLLALMDSCVFITSK